MKNFGNLNKKKEKKMDPGENCDNVKYHDSAKDKEDRSDVLSAPKVSSCASKLGPRTAKLAVIDQLFLFYNG